MYLFGAAAGRPSLVTFLEMTFVVTLRFVFNYIELK